MQRKKGIIVSIEGIDGSGKTTQAKMLKDYLESKGYNAILLKEPTDGRFGKKIRSILTTQEKPDQFIMVELYALDRKENVEKNIIPSLKEGKIIILDRYVVSSLAYQSVDGISLEQILEKNSFAPIPDIVVILDLPEDEALKRLAKKNKIMDSFEKREFLKKVRMRYKEIIKILNKFKGWENTEIIVVDAMKTPSDIFNEIKEKVINLIRRRLLNDK